MDLPPSVRPYDRKIWAKKVTTKTLGGITLASWLRHTPLRQRFERDQRRKRRVPNFFQQIGMLASSRFGYWSSWLHTGSSGSGSSA